jgi:catechol 2,3-dioxygenase-like lactoylglutathione lyase family enzyme
MRSGPGPSTEPRRKANKKIWLTGVFVDDVGKALGFYTEVLGFVKKADFTNGPYRRLTVVSPEEPDGAQLHLEANGNPASKMDPKIASRDWYS